MKLNQIHVVEFQSILDSGEFEVGEITCLVGKNESGKTALLQALYRLNPIIEGDGKYSVTDDYPRRNVEDYRLSVEAGERKHAVVVKALFELEEDDVEAVAAMVGHDALRGRILTLSNGYDDALRFEYPVDESAALRHLAAQHQFLPEVAGELDRCDTVVNALDVLGRSEPTEAVQSLVGVLQEVQQSNGFEAYLYKKVLNPRVPKFLYFDEYYQMKGRAHIEALKQRMEAKKLEPSDYPLLGLINRARLNLDGLLNPARTRELKNRLEGSGNHLTNQVVKYWSQNRYLQLRFDVRPARPDDPEGMKQGTNIWSDVYDSKHMVTTELGTRSRGFVWFFSFLAWYGDIQREKQKAILLLDEPGLSLHAKAQEDLLRYFETEVKGNHQLIYTTHSPFMVDPTHFERVRIVQDLGIETDEELPPENEGTKVLTDVLEATGDSLFPLQGALGYEIYQTLFVGPNSLVVEGVSDLLYLQTMSALLEEQGRTGLGKEWTITPVGGSDKVPTFVALIGAQKHLNVAVLVDYQKKDRQPLENLYKRKLLEKKKVLTFADFTAGEEADIEDMFDLDFYVKLVNRQVRDGLQETECAVVRRMVAMRTKSKGIVSWPQEERPRERLLSRGAQALTDAELVAILVRVGFKGTSAVELGRQLLKQFGSLRAMVEAPVIALLEVKGLKGAKAAQLLAAMEIARRVGVPAQRGALVIKSTKGAAEYLRERMCWLSEEQFRVLYLNRRNALLEDALIAQGSVESVRPPLRTIVARALQANASALIAAHNHPSGVAEASESDRLLTQDMITATRPLGLKLLDHVIVAEGTTFSFADSGLLDELELLCLAPGDSRRQPRLSRGAR